MSKLDRVLRWSALCVLRPYLRNRLVDRGKWFLVSRLNPAPGLEADWASLGTKRCRMRGGAEIYCEMIYAADRTVYFTGEYEVTNTRLIRRILNHKWRFIDVGANVGKYTLIAAGLANEVVAIEPNPISVARLKANLNLNHFDNVRIVTCGLSDQQMLTSLRQNGLDIGGATLLGDRPFTDERPIEVMPGDEVVTPSNLRTYLKVDVEGLEFRVLRGFKRLLASRQVLVQVEITAEWLRADGGSAEELFRFMQELGYSAFRVTRHTCLRTTVDVERLEQPLNLFQYDAFFAPASDRDGFWRWAESKRDSH